MSSLTHLTTVHLMDTTTTLTTAAKRTINALQAWWDDEAGVTAIEYGLMAALIAVACVAIFQATGGELQKLYVYWTTFIISAIENV